MKIVKISLIIVAFSTLALVACEETPEEPTVFLATEHQFESLLSEAQIDYTVPAQVPNIMVNQLGYLSGADKMAIFRGADVGGVFRVVDADSGRTVLSGNIEERGYNATFDEYLSYGSFTDLDMPGRYYLEAPAVGRSFFFSMGDNLYDPVWLAVSRQYYLNRCGYELTEEYAGHYAREACHTEEALLLEDESISLDVSGGWHQDAYGSKDTYVAAKVAALLLLSYELNGPAYTDQTGIPESDNQIPDLLDEVRFGVEWLLKMQDAASGGVYAGLTFEPQEGRAYVEPVSAEATKIFCAVMAKFSYLYQGFDNAYATQCLRAAERAWRYLEQNHGETIDETYFFAATEMFRASGQQSYNRIVTRYLRGDDYQELFVDTLGGAAPDGRQEVIMLGTVSYLLTKSRAVDRELCNEIMKTILLFAEDISARSRASQYLTAANEKQDNNNELLADMLFLSVVNYVITNYEYGAVIENHLHFFMGRNSALVSYIDDVGAINYKDMDSHLGIMNHIEANAKLLFMLSGVTTGH